MLLFRSEEHVRAWYGDRQLPDGGALTLEQAWQLARAWYADRASPTWRRRTAEQAEEVFGSLGLRGGFWRLLASGS